MIAKTADLIKEGKLEGIAEIRDESDRNGMRIVYILRMDAIPNIVLNLLFKHTALQSSFSVNNIALVNGRPEQLNLKDLILHFVNHRHDVVIRRTQFELRKAEERAHILEGYMKVIGTQDDLDRAIKIIRESATPDDARNGLIEAFDLSEIQARAILELRLRTLTGLEIDKIRSEYEELMKTIEYLKEVLSNEDLRMSIIKEELEEIKEKYGDERRSEINYAGGDMNIEDLIPDEEMVLTISHAGYIKRTPLTEYRKQSRGGIGNRGATTRDEDFLEYMVVANSHQYMLFFTEKGKCYWMRVFEIPEGSKVSKGRAIQNLINIEQDDKIKAYINVEDLTDEEYINNHYIVMCTKKGIIKKTILEAYSRPRANGINAININEGDELIEAKLTNGHKELILAKKSGYAIRFNESTVRTVGRNSIGVKGVTMSTEDDEVIGMISLDPDSENSILVVSENGYGKRSYFNDPETGEPIYRVTNRGGKGVKTMNVTEKTGNLISIKNVTDEDDLMIITKNGITIRLPIDQVRVMGRAAQGVIMIKLGKNEEIAAVAKVPKEEEVVDVLEDGENEDVETGGENDENNGTNNEEE